MRGVTTQVTFTLDIAKAAAEQQVVFGWGSVAVTKTGETVVDSQGHTIDIAELELAAYRHVIEARAQGVEHQGDAIGTMVESLVVTPDKLDALGLAGDALPLGWWVGYQVDDATWARVKSGELRALSIQGTAEEVA